MRINEGTLDRALRVVVGLALLSMLVLGAMPGWGLWGLIGLAPLLTGVTGFCPTYTLFGIDTRDRSAHSSGG